MDPETLKEVPVGSVGEVWMKGVNLMQEYWKDPEATKRVMTADGWLRSVLNPIIERISRANTEPVYGS